MITESQIKWFTVLSLAAYCGCKEPFNPPNTKGAVPAYLVVDATVSTSGIDSHVSLSRTQSLADSLTNAPEGGAQISLLGSTGTAYPFYETAPGKYAPGPVTLNPAERFQLMILTRDGKKYLTDSVTVLISPPIDSISWQQDTTGPSNKIGVSIFVTTHDQTNTTRYYRWEYQETWKYHSKFFSVLYYSNGALYPRADSQLIYYCYRDFPSTGLNLATSANLSQDIIYAHPLVFIPQDDEKLSIRYSILVKQYALTREAYNYWENLKKNTELTGSIFDPQPSTLTGNIHCVTNPDEPVLGYVSISNISQQRIFISNDSLAHWGYQIFGCAKLVIIYLDWLTYGYIPLYITQTALWAAPSECVDCTLSGGTTSKPSFW